MFTSSDHSHGGFLATKGVGSTGKHVTALITVVASGLVAPPFFVVVGKQVLKDSVDPLDGTIFGSVGKPKHWLGNEDWFPSDGVAMYRERQ